MPEILANPTPNGNADGMTRREREDLATLVRRREKLAKERSKQLDAERLADVERQLATIFKADDKRWADIVAQAQHEVRQAEEKIQHILDSMDVPDEFRPHLALSWHGRGWNEDKSRRAELRMVARTRVEADGKAARMEIERQSVEVQTALLAGGLTTSAARAFLDSMPTADALMPRIDVLSLDAAKVFAGLVSGPSATAMLLESTGGERR